MAKKTKHTTGPWAVEWEHKRATRAGPAHDLGTIVAKIDGVTVPVARCNDRDDAALLASAPELLREAQVLLCLATSPRFQGMTVAAALAELAANGCGHDGGAAIAKVEGRS